MPNSGYFDTIFGVDGDLTPVPDAVQSSGALSYTQGWGGLYSTPVGNGGLNISRSTMNRIFYDITAVLQQYQQFGVPPFITGAMNGGSPFSYSLGAQVLNGGLVYLSLADNNTDIPPSAKWMVANFRQRLTANATYYVSGAGNDANPGTSGLPWLTIQHAINVVSNTLDLAGFSCTIRVIDGNYTSPINITQPFVGGIPVLSGNVSTPGSCTISTTNSNCINVNGGAQINIQGFQLSASSLGSGIIASGSGAQANLIGKMAYGATAGVGSSQIYATDGASINILSPYSIVAGANAHWIALDGGEVNGGGNAATLTGTPAFTSQFAQAGNQGLIQAAGMTFSGSATGVGYIANANGVIQTNGAGASFFPGNSAGSTATGGQYI